MSNYIPCRFWVQPQFLSLMESFSNEIICNYKFNGIRTADFTGKEFRQILWIFDNNSLLL